MTLDRDKIKLEFPAMHHIPSYIEALREGFVRGAGKPMSEEEITDIASNPKTYIEELNAPPNGSFTTPTGETFAFVPGETLWLCAEDIFIGEVSFRHKLNAFLEQYGGHVGYGVRPSLMGNGYATLAMEFTKARAAARGMEELLLTCSPTNPASEAVIRKSGGVYIDTLDAPFGMEPTKRFRVPTGLR